MPGIDPQRIAGKDEEDLDELICGICQGVFDEPVVTQCCRQTYCKSCINLWLTNNSTCPNDRQRLTVNMLQQPPRLVQNILTKLKIKCVNFLIGCETIMTMDKMKLHIKICNPCSACQESKKVIINLNKEIEMLKDQLKNKVDELFQSSKIYDKEKKLLKIQLRNKDDELRQKQQQVVELEAQVNKKDAQLSQLRLDHPTSSALSPNKRARVMPSIITTRCIKSYLITHKDNCARSDS